jgi:exodeoxyribonuclease III
VRIATWNVNSIRSRIDRVEAFLERHDIDVLALQETKAREDQLPLMGLQSLGYEVAAAGYNQWNGVAVISRVGLEDVEVGFPDMPMWDEVAEARALGVSCAGVRVWSLYVPNGRKVDDPHYFYKLEWLAKLRDAAATWTGDPVALVGDWNIAPLDEDVFDMAAFAKDTHVTHPSGPRSTRSWTPGTSTSYARTPPVRRCTRTGTTTGSASSATAACGSTSCSARSRSPIGSPAPSSTATSGPARAPAITPRSSSISVE